ncbi:hypothetical protein IWX78_003197 [Mycetocola sp. CAN_C7]|uniref:hypothetical protein n=1 Tax=Mycetocola sp. CAN_C7 TaxID=2787724 RepID=UPI0018C8E8BA
MSTPETNPFRKKSFIAATIIVGVIVLAAIIVLVTSILGGSNVETPPASTPSSSPDDSPSAQPVEDPSVCGLEGFETENTLDSAPDTEWELVGTVAAPADPNGAGPGTVENGFRSCYAHTAEGALFAAVGYIAVSSDSRNTPRLYELLASGPVRDQLEASPETGDPSATRLQVAGFKVNSYTSTEATIDAAWRVTSEGGGLVSFPTVLRWENGDWKVVIGENGPPFAPSPLTNLGGYIPWAGV